MKKVFIFLFVVSAIFSSCSKDNDSTSIKELSFVKTISVTPDEENVNVQNIEVAGDGSIFISFRTPSGNSITSIYKYSFSGTLLSKIIDSNHDANINFYSFYIDLNDHLQIISSVNTEKYIREYGVDGNYISGKSLSGLTSNSNFALLFYGNYPYTVDNEGGLYSVPGDDNSPIIKINSDYTELSSYLTQDDVVELFANQDGTQILLSDIAYYNNKLYITVDRIAEDEDKDKDGILILDNNLNKVDFIGKDWLFNGPTSISFDNNNMYVTSTYAKDIKVFNSSLTQVAKFENSSDKNVLNTPKKIAVKGDYVYVVDYNNGYIVNIFEAIK